MKARCNCGQIFTSQADFYHHMRERHPYQDLNFLWQAYSVPETDAPDDRMLNLEWFSEIRNMLLNKYGAQYQIADQIIEEIYTITKYKFKMASKQKSYVCAQCAGEFDTPAALIDHVETAHDFDKDK